jgi:hypothetical protein
MKRLRCFAVLTLVVATLIAVETGYAQGVAVEGTIIDGKSGLPIPGLRVSLVHQALGRSKTAITNSSGQFMLLSIPIRRDPYYLEVYWGNTLKYRSKLMVEGRLRIPPIRLGT